MNFGAFTPVKREVIVTFTNGEETTLNTALSYDDIRHHIQFGGFKQVKSIKDRF